MAISLNDFKNIAANNPQADVKMQGNDGLSTRGTSFFGKVANWFQATFAPGSVRQENGTVMQSFCNAIKDRYPGKLGDYAASIVRNSHEGGQPLKSREISQVLTSLDEQVKEIRQDNQDLVAKFSKPGNPEFNAIFSRIATDLGLPADQSKYDLSRIQGKVSGATIRDVASSESRQTENEVKTAAETEITKLLQSRAAMLAHVDTMDISQEMATKLAEIVLENTSVKTTAHLDVLVAAAATAGELINSLKDMSAGGTSLPLMHAFTNTHFDNLGSIPGADDWGADQNVEFRANVFDLAMVAQGLNEEEATAAYEAITPNLQPLIKLAGAGMMGDLHFVESDEAMARFGRQEEQVYLYDMQSTAMMMMHFLSKAAGIDEGRFGNDIDQEYYGHLGEVPTEMIRDMRAVGMNIREEKAFSINVKDDLTFTYNSADFWPMAEGDFNDNDINKQFTADVGRGTFILNGQNLSNLDNPQAGLLDGLRNENGWLDVFDVRLLSSVANQTAFAPIMEALYDDLQAVTGSSAVGKRVIFDVTRNEEGGFDVKFLQREHLNMLMSTVPGKPSSQELDPEKSFLQVEMNLRISRDEVTDLPKVVILDDEPSFIMQTVEAQP